MEIQAQKFSVWNHPSKRLDVSLREYQQPDKRGEDK
jgi:hypothetical protein